MPLWLSPGFPGPGLLLGTSTLGLSSVTTGPLIPTNHPHPELGSELLLTPKAPLRPLP